MAENLNISFEEGYKEFTINNDPKRILRVNVGDIGLIDRMEKSIKEMKEKISEIDDIKIDVNGNAESALAEEAEAVRKVNSIMRKSFDSIFYPGASNIVFGKQNPIALVKGKTIYELFLESFAKTVKPMIEEEARHSEERVNKYKEQYDKAAAFKDVAK
ncbi:MAG: hypothetical protein E7185_09800 [Erysipelotrichaceae bacterium]|nr:hypothetical protein [Erysipelotrichaceae bacterium]